MVSAVSSIIGRAFSSTYSSLLERYASALALQATNNIGVNSGHQQAVSINKNEVQ